MREIAKNIKPTILKEQFVPDNVFLYVAKGGVRFFDGNKSCTLKAGECGIIRKNRLAKFELLDSKDDFDPIVFCFDEPFLQGFLKKYKTKRVEFKTNDAFIKIRKTGLVDDFIHSLKPYYKGFMELDEAFEELKYEELVIILLKNQPELVGILFDFGIPEKINLEEFMNRNYKFNVSIKRLAYLTGRSLSAFKRDFNQLFNDTPNHWLVRRRLQEAYFLIDKKNKKPTEIYLDLGFEDLSHFSHAFKKLFGLTPTELTAQAKNTIR